MCNKRLNMRVNNFFSLSSAYFPISTKLICIDEEKQKTQLCMIQSHKIPILMQYLNKFETVFPNFQITCSSPCHFRSIHFHSIHGFLKIPLFASVEFHSTKMMGGTLKPTLAPYTFHHSL